MARKSRKFNKNMPPPVSPSHKYSVGAYLRVSVESDSSIFSQEAILTKYIKEHSEFQLHKLYVDNGVSSFFEERTEFDKLIRDAESKIIDCIIVKDFSRFTRDYIEFGDYLEQIFPVWGIRFISIFDNYDSEGIYGITDFAAALRSIINASYSRDISTKVKSSVRIKKLKGTYIAARLPYGYSKNVSVKPERPARRDCLVSVKPERPARRDCLFVGERNVARGSQAYWDYCEYSS